MASSSVINSSTVSKKCGEIIITMKQNAKNVYSFNCWFCNTIHIQMKKFTLHLEQEHVTQLENTTHLISEHNESNFEDKSEIQKAEEADNILVGEIKIEDCANDYIKSETEEDNSQTVTRYNKKVSPNTFLGTHVQYLMYIHIKKTSSFHLK